jgi:phospholipid/cholesterol/gamma-HCH transport system permease protein
MQIVESEATREWLHAVKSAFRMYGNFFFWLFREIFITAVVLGGIHAWLGGWYGGKFSVIYWSGGAIVYLLLSEATTLIGAMIFAARIGTAFTVEIGSMQMSGQLDALRLMAVEPVQYIVIPRVLASILCLIFLKALSDGVAILSSLLFASWWFKISFPIYLQHVWEILRTPILTTSYIRSALMAFLISINGCGLGFYFNGGAVELGRTTTKSIVINLIVVITIDSLYGVIDSLLGWSTV